MCEALSKRNAFLKTLRLGCNFSVRSPQRTDAIHSLGMFLNSPGCALTALHLDGAPKHELKADLLPVLNGECQHTYVPFDAPLN